MSPPIELTSVPPWALTATTPAADLTGRAYTVVAFGEPGRAVADRWAVELGEHLDDSAGGVRTHVVADIDAARDAVALDLATARVGWRLLVAGPLVEVMALRATAIDAGLADDEITIATTTTDRCAVLCSHCASRVIAQAEIGDVVTCTGCSRDLLIYHHVSRRQAAFLGFMVDAEVWEG